MNRLPDTPLSDENLGSLLGESISRRVDAAPAAAPSFAGVERRARQITRRRRTAAGIAIGAVVLFGGVGAATLVADDEGATDTDVVTEPAPDTEEPVVEPAPDTEQPVVEPPTAETEIRVTGLIDNRRFVGVDADGTEGELLAVTGDERITDAMVLADGSILAVVTDALLDPSRRVVHYAEPGVEPTVLSENGFLSGGAVVDGVPYAFVGDAVEVDADLSFEPTPLRRIDLSTGSSVDLLEAAFGTEWQISDLDVRGGDLLYVDLSEGGWTWFLTTFDAANRIPLRSGSWADDVWPTAPRFSRVDEGYWWVERHLPTESWSLVHASTELVELDRIALDVGSDRTEIALQLEVTDDLMVINIIGDPTEPPLEFTTIWVDPLTLTPSLESEAGVIGFVEPPESTTTTDPEPTEPARPDGVDPEGLGIVSIESDTNIDDFGPIEVPLVAHDENGTVWAATPGGDDVTGLADLWRVDGIRGVRYVVDPDDPTDRNWLFDLGERVVHVDGDGQARVIADPATLVGAAMVDGRPTASVADPLAMAEVGVETGDLRTVDLATGETTVMVGGASRIDRIVTEVFVGRDRTFVETIGSDPLSIVLGSTPAELPDPEGVLTSALSPDGDALFWLTDLGVDPQTLRPQVELHTLELDSDAAAVVTIDLPATEVALDYDLVAAGSRLLVNRSWSGGLVEGVETTNFAAPLSIDPATGEVTELGLPAGNWKPVAR